MADRLEPGDVARLAANFTTQPRHGEIGRLSNQLALDGTTGYTDGDTILIQGAGPAGADLITTISSVSGNVVTIAATADTAVANTQVGKLTDVSPTCTISKPDGTTSTPPVTRDAIGQYHVDYTTDQAGVHRYEFAGTGGVIAGTFEVQPSNYAQLSPRALCTLEEFNQQLGNVNVSDDDATRIRLINGASSDIHREAGREFVAKNAVRDPVTGVVTVDPETRTFIADREVVWWRDLYVGDLAATTWAGGGVLTVTAAVRASAAPTSLVTTDLAYLPETRDPWEPIRRIRFPASVGLIHGYFIAVTGVWGFPEIPDDIRVACLQLAAGRYLRDVRRWAQQADETGAYLPGSMIGSALATARAYRIDVPVADAQVC